MTVARREPQEVLREEILADARRQADRILRRAKRDAEGILSRARQAADKAREEQLAAAQNEVHRRRNLILATVPVEVARMRAERMEAALEAVRDEARSRLLHRDGFDYRKTLIRLAADAIARMDGRRFVMELSAADRVELGDGLAKAVCDRVGREGLEVTLATGPADIEAGITIRDADGRQVWNNRLAARLERLWPTLRCEIGAGALLTPAGGKAEES